MTGSETPQGLAPRERPADDGALLKRNVKRSVHAVLAADGTRTLLKTYHAPGFGRWRDRLRALGEHRAHRDARAAGLPCAAPLGTERVAGRWALRLAWIEGARSLEEHLGAGSPPGGRVALARRLGALALEVERARFVHADPHGGNLLVGPSGSLHIVDLARSRTGASDARLERQWTTLCARLRELDRRVLKAADAHWRRLGGGSTVPPGDAIDRAAREQRAAEIERRVRVWRRTSSSTVVETVDGRAAVRTRRPAPSGWIEQEIRGERAVVEAAWAVLVRATLHGLPCAHPVACALEAPWSMTFAVPGGAAAAGAAASPSGELARALADRSLDHRGELFIHQEFDAQWIGPRSTLTHVGARP